MYIYLNVCIGLTLYIDRYRYICIYLFIHLFIHLYVYSSSRVDPKPDLGLTRGGLTVMNSCLFRFLLCRSSSARLNKVPVFAARAAAGMATVVGGGKQRVRNRTL